MTANLTGSTKLDVILAILLVMYAIGLFLTWDRRR